MCARLWCDEAGAVLSAELALIMVLLVIGMVVGLTALRDAVDLRLGDIAGAIAALDPGYEFTGLSYNSDGDSGGIIVGSHARVNGSSFTPVELPTQPTVIITAIPPTAKNGL